MIELITTNLTLATRGFTDIIDISPHLQNIVKESGLKEGQLLVFIPGSTAGLTTVEFESGLEADLKAFFEKIIPMDGTYQHNVKWHDGNGYAHVRASLLKPTLIIPFNEARMCLGTWQQVVFIDFDNRPRNRQLIVQLTGQS